MKKFLAILATTAAVASANQSSPFHGLSLGGHLGYGTLSGTVNNLETSLSSPASGKLASSSGMLLGINGMAGYVFQSNLYLGLGLNATLYSVNATTNAIPFGNSTLGSVETKLKLKNSFEASARLGFVCGSFLPFLEIGVVSAAVKADSRAGTLNATGSSNKRLNGFSFGAGVATALNDKLSAEVKLTHTTFKKKTFSLYDGSAEEAKTTIKPKFTALTVGLRYKVATF